MNHNTESWSKPSAVEYYAEHRQTVEDLYPSERVFLPRVLFPGARVLDVGCASGGFYNIMRTLEPAIDYTGTDISAPSVEIARRRFPEARFMVTDGIHLPFDNAEFDLAHCTSVLVVEPRCRDVIQEMYRVANRFVLVDLRLMKATGDITDVAQSSYRIEFGGKHEATVPYVILDADGVLDFFLSLRPRPKAVRATGYYHTVSPMASTPFPEVCMGIFLLEKGSDHTGDTELDLDDLPITFATPASRARAPFRAFGS